MTVIVRSVPRLVKSTAPWVAMVIVPSQMSWVKSAAAVAREALGTRVTRLFFGV